MIVRSSREATVRAIGAACYGMSAVAAGIGLFAVGLGIATFRSGVGLADLGFPGGFATLFSIAAMMNFLVAYLAFRIGRGLRQLLPRTRRACVVLLGLALVYHFGVSILAWSEDGPLAGVGVWLCLVMPAAAMLLLMSKKSAEVFDPAYREAVEQSPTPRPSLSLRAKLGGFALTGLFVLGVSLAVMAVRSG